MRFLGKFKNDQLISIYTNIKTAAEDNEVSAPAISMSMKHGGKCRNANWKWLDIKSDIILEAIQQTL